ARHHTLGRLRLRRGSLMGNAMGKVWRLSSQLGSRRLVPGIAEVDADPQRRWQSLPSLDHLVEPALVGERKYRSGSPKLDVAVESSQLAIGELDGVAPLQLVEHPPASSFGLQHQPLADFVPYGFEWILARA